MLNPNPRGTRTVNSRRQAAHRAVLSSAAITALAVLLAACGSSSSSSTSSSGSSPGAKSGNRTALTACLRKHGVTLPAGGKIPGGGTPPPAGAGAGTAPTGAKPPAGAPGGGAGGTKLQSALKACGAKFPARPGSAGFSHQAIQKYVTCVRQHGYNLPSANFSGRGSVFPSSVRSNPKFKAASRACQSLLTPKGGGHLMSDKPPRTRSRRTQHRPLTLNACAGAPVVVSTSGRWF